MTLVRAFLILLGVVGVALPLGVHAADIPLLSPGWSLVPEVCRACPCGFAGVLAIVQNLMNAGIGVAIVFGTMIIAWAGFLYITTPANPEARGQASNMLINAAVGLLIVLSAWLIVDFVMKILYNPNNAGWGPWNTILGDATGESCIQSTTTQPLFSGAISVTQLPTGTTSTGTGTGNYKPGGTCSVQTSGPCAPSNLGIFANAANEASEICAKEGLNNARTVSGVDKLGDGTPYSFGLFQINITAHSLGNLNCPQAFNNGGRACTVRSCGPGTGIKVTNPDLYNKCVEAAKTPSINITKAHDIYMKAHASWSPWGAAKGCGLAYLPQLAPVLAIMNLCTPERS